MATKPATPAPAGKATPRDFFLWLGAIIALYGSITAFLALLFEYINRAFPDPLAGWADPYGSSIRFCSAVLIVLVPTMVVLLRVIRHTIQEDQSRATIWVRRWALVLTVFIASAVVAVDLITLLYSFFNGEISTRFLLKVAVVLLVAIGVSGHFLADLRGYWVLHPRRAHAVGLAVGLLALLAVAAGFLIAGSPHDARLLRYDEQKVSDLQGIQYQVVNHYQQKGELPGSLAETNDPLSSYMVPMDPQTGMSYEYEIVDADGFSFRLCAAFNLPTPDTAGQGAYPIHDLSYAGPGMPLDENWLHDTGRTCFDRTIDPDRYPQFDAERSQTL